MTFLELFLQINPFILHNSNLADKFEKHIDSGINGNMKWILKISIQC